VALTPCGHRSDKNRIYEAKEFKKKLKHCKQLRKLYLQTEKVEKKMLHAINKNPFKKEFFSRRAQII
jgi:sulfatase maturation enzyme AslB (radical SAM superfamily)